MFSEIFPERYKGLDNQVIDSHGKVVYGWDDSSLLAAAMDRKPGCAHFKYNRQTKKYTFVEAGPGYTGPRVINNEKLNPIPKSVDLRGKYDDYKADYSSLEKSLIQKNWKQAERETVDLMLKVCNYRPSLRDGTILSGFNLIELDEFPIEIISEIDRLWLEHSNGHFGFSVQAKILKEFLAVNAQTDEFIFDINSFGRRVGWLIGTYWLNYGEQKFNIDAPKGHLPLPLPVIAQGAAWNAFSLRATCEYFGLPVFSPKDTSLALEYLSKGYMPEGFFTYKIKKVMRIKTIEKTKKYLEELTAMNFPIK